MCSIKHDPVAGGRVPLTRIPSMVVISDRVERDVDRHPAADERPPWRGRARSRPEVVGGYLERFPLACIAAGIAEQAEIWHHRTGGGPASHHLAGGMGYRGFPIDDPVAPFDNRAMLDFVREHGAPHILVVYGLGVGAALLEACADSIIIYNSIDAPTWRVPAAVSAHVDLVLTGAPWQSEEVEARHPGMASAIMPVGPEFAAIDQFRPIDGAKDYDLIYVAAAQPYKRHDLLLDALEELPRDVRALLVFGYGEDGDAIRRRIAEAGLSVDCIGPPGVAVDEVNRLMNRARFGIVCGRDDGAPAILTEYMLAGLPVLCCADLVCGRQYILPETGMLVPPERLAEGIMAMRDAAAGYAPRATVLARWTWPHTIARLRPLLAELAKKKMNKLISIN
jgi:glycosyltransferase involved in cell wall biosynthesis